MRTLVDAATLREELAGARPPVVLDVRWRLLGPPGAADHAAGHVPGAVFLDLERDLAGPPGSGEGRHPLPEPLALEAALRRAGVRAGHPVVVYDDRDGTAAARLWWLLRWAGHDDVRVLDGGWSAWRAAGGEVDAALPVPEPGDVVVGPGCLPVLDAAGAAALAAAPGGRLLDARATARYRGETEPVDPVAGHIPGARNAPHGETLTADGRLLPPTELAARFAALGVRPGEPVGAYCGSGVTAAQLVLALAVAGHEDAVLYPGSWSGWITDRSRPVATGPDPGDPG